MNLAKKGKGEREESRTFGTRRLFLRLRLRRRDSCRLSRSVCH